jgi:hypothetical protein
MHNFKLFGIYFEARDAKYVNLACKIIMVISVPRKKDLIYKLPS